MKKIKYIIFILFFYCNISFANENIKINIINGDNIDEQTIYSILDTYEEINDDQLNNIIKKLKKNKYISDVNILKQDNIYIIEWPEILLRQKYLTSYYLIKFEIENLNLRKIKIIHTDKNLSLNIND